ncbi:DUF2971 domain-containing protein [Shimia sp.]|uniref:DUF2971 domain-containing protein n=1 Tax=Shimia sp. TaxID=1954381 RepID=UPI003B8DE2F6
MSDARRLYYFTGPNFALDIIARRHLKISFPNEVNDIFELSPFDFGEGERAKAARRAWRSSIDEMSKETGFISFSKRWTVPTMWGHYAENNKGVCFGFDVSGDLTKIDYTAKFSKFDPANLEGSDKFGKAQSLWNYALRTKSRHWRYESEWRKYVELSESDLVLRKRGAKQFFLPFNDDLVLKEIIIGSQKKFKAAEFEAALGEYRGVTIKTARPSFRDFKIVKDKSRRTIRT